VRQKQNEARNFAFEAFHGGMTRPICKIARAKSEIAHNKSQMTCVILLFARAKSQFNRAK
jgi:hypothetical protein